MPKIKNEIIGLFYELFFTAVFIAFIYLITMLFAR